MICAVADCDREAKARGWCRKHYERWYTYGDPTTPLLRRANGDVPEHGTYTRYASKQYACRCADCREAKRLYVTQRRAAGLEPSVWGEVPRPAWHNEAPRGRGAEGKRVGLSRVLLPNVTHGTAGAYRKGCRCWACTDAATAADRARRARRKRAA